ncbi:MAG: ferrochelatase, partial [Planctomycetota bacterium]
MAEQYDAVLLVSFGGPEGPDDVMPFLENVLRGRNVPRERMLEVSEHYQHFGGVSPINDQNRALIEALQPVLNEKGPNLPIYWGNRNWHPMLADTMQKMADDGIKRALAVLTSAFSCYSGCRQYREDIMKAQEAVGEAAPVIDKMRVYYNHPGFVGPVVEQVQSALNKIEDESRRASAHLIFTAHSIPIAMSDGSKYVWQLEESSRLVAEQLGYTSYRLVYQSRSGPPTQPWLEPDVCDYIEELHEAGEVKDVVIVPI